MSGSTDQHTGLEAEAAPVVPAQQRTGDTADTLLPTVEQPTGTCAGTVLGGRYRLHTRVGSDAAAGAEFWRAEDTILRRDVAMTILRRPAPDARLPAGAQDPTAATRARDMVVRALRSGSFEHPGCARLLDVLAPDTTDLPEDVLGVSVTEWVPGRSIAEVVSAGLLKPAAAARAVQPLAAAAEEAHRHGFVLGCDHPQRIRVTPEGRAQLCFALPRPDLQPTDDVRGLGAVLFALLTSRWPLSGADAAWAGLSAADRHGDGRPIPPSALRPGVPVELDALAIGALGGGDAATQVRTAAAVRRLIDEVVVEDDRLALFPPVPDGLPSSPGDVWQDQPADSPDPDRRRKLKIGLSVLAAAVLLVAGFIAVQVGALFSDPPSPTIVVSEPVGPSGSAPGPTPQAAPSGGPVRVASVEVVDPVGDRDNPGRITRVIDGDPATTWNTFTYRQQFPALKPGVGILSSFASAVQLSAIEIDSPSPGTRVEIRSAPTADAEVEDTLLMAEADLGNGRTTISLADSQPVEHVLVWITRLGGGGEENVTAIAEIEFLRA
jgi:hypothetical protein